MQYVEYHKTIAWYSPTEQTQSLSFFYRFLPVSKTSIERLRNENEDKTKTQMTQSFNQYSENETKIWRQNILNQFNRVSSSCLRSHFVISLIKHEDVVRLKNPLNM